MTKNSIQYLIGYKCCESLKITSNNTLCIDAPGICGSYHLEYIDSNQNPVYHNEHYMFLFHDLDVSCYGHYFKK